MVNFYGLKNKWAKLLLSNEERFHNFFTKDIITLILLKKLAALFKTSGTIFVVINLARLHVQTNKISKKLENHIFKVLKEKKNFSDHESWFP